MKIKRTTRISVHIEESLVLHTRPAGHDTGPVLHSLGPALLDRFRSLLDGSLFSKSKINKEQPSCNEHYH